MRGNDPYLKSIKEAIRDQIRAGVDIISDGQTRGDMISSIASKLDGIEGDKIKWDVRHKGDITTKDYLQAEMFAEGRALVKGILTGPFTLASYLKNEHYKDPRELILDIAGALADEVKRLCTAGAPLIQIDEPIFSSGFETALAKEALDKIYGASQAPLALHVCGDVSPAYPELLEIPCDILDHEFTHHPRLLDILEEYNFDKRVGYGCVDTQSNKIEAVDTIRARIERALEYFDEKDLLIDPDCGMRNLRKSSAFGKLKNMCDAVKAIKGE